MTVRMVQSGARASFDDKVALITGAAQGIGLETARLLAARGARVVLADVAADRLAAIAREFPTDRWLTVEADVRVLDSMESAVRAILDRFGRLDVVVANAGVTPPPATLRTVAPEAFERVVDINLLGVFNTVRAGIEPVIAAGGHIEVVGSCAAFAPGMGGAAYMISKAGVEQLGRALRIELAAHGASAGIAYFGIVETALTRATLDDDELGREIGSELPWPLSRRITAQDAAAVIVDAVAGRRARVIAPRQWTVYAALRGLINPLLDLRLERDKGIRDLIRRLEERQRGLSRLG
ncbi:short-chain dehydrogenase/reductase [Gordonia sp. CPCC 205515]|uniref:short-chain dehydrogenase/reductase n=1 Tax=Gordonia sp. CPCC 205515 TaxID=3140791 RepID=UPI003AF35661